MSSALRLPQDASKERSKARRWRQDEGGSRLLEDEAETEESIKRKLELHAEIFGASTDAPHAIDVSADGLNDRQRMTASELGMGDWRRGSLEPPKALPLPGMLAARLFGAYGVSIHGDKAVRLWDLASGRRLAAHQQKVEPTAVAAHGTMVAVGDGAGAVHLYGTESTFAPLRLPPLKPAAGAVHSLALVPFFEESDDPFVLVLASYEDGVVSASLAHTTPWPPPRVDALSRVTLPLPELSAQLGAAGSRGAISLVAGDKGCVYGVAGSSVAMCAGSPRSSHAAAAGALPPAAAHLASRPWRTHSPGSRFDARRGRCTAPGMI